jgi:hypothetical protein
VKWKLQVVLTKCDLVERFELARRIQVLKQKVCKLIFSSLFLSFLLSVSFASFTNMLSMFLTNIVVQTKLFFVESFTCTYFSYH